MSGMNVWTLLSITLSTSLSSGMGRAITSLSNLHLHECWLEWRLSFPPRWDPWSGTKDVRDCRLGGTAPFIA